MQSLANGTQLGAYTIVRLIGRGGMGEVYEAYENRLQRRVALKVIAPAKAGTHGEVDLVRRFLQEARTLAQINHPNVVTIYSIDRVNDVQFIAMEYVEGASFKDLFTLFAFSADEAAPAFMQLLEGLKALHDNRILHRDIKPHNLMMRPDGRVKILDFGIAKRLNDRERENTTVGVVVGTLSYLPPEVLYGAPATPRSDLWSLGAIFYEMLVGQPLVSMTSIKVKGARAAADSDVIFPQDCLGWVPVEMRAIVGKLCDRTPEMRYENAASAMQDLKRYEANRPPVPHETVKAMFHAIDEIEDLKESVDKKTLIDSKSKREFTLSVLGGHGGVEAVPDVQPIEEADPALEPIMTTGVVRDSISARRKAQSRSRRAKQKWRMPALIAGGVFVVLLIILKVASGGKHEEVKVEPTQAASNSEELHMISPSEKQTLWLDPVALPTLTWSKVLESGEYELQIATDTKFNSILIREDVSGTFYRPGRILPEGEYHWQLWPKRPALKPIGPSLFTVAFLRPLEMTWPKSEQTFDLGRGQKTQTVNFKWKCKPGVKKYGAQVAIDSGFTQVVQETMSSSCSWSDVRLGPGTYHWRVRAEEPVEAQSATLARQSFTIKGTAPVVQPPVVLAPAPQITPTYIPTPKETPQPRAEQAKLTSPHLKSPKQAITLRFAKGSPIRDIASARKRMLETPTLSWQAIRGAKSYVLQISPTPEFSRQISEETVSGSTFEWKQAAAGKHYWRVRAVSEGNVFGPFSSTGSIEVNLPEPVLNASYNLGEKTTFAWDPVPMAEKYIVQISADRNMASVADEKVDQAEVPMGERSGTNYVRIAAANAQGERVSGFSQIATITMETPLKLMAPGLVTPPIGAKVTLPKSGRISIVFSWNPIEKATDYTIEFSRQQDFGKIVQHHTVRDTRWVIKGAKFNGKIYWRVRSEALGKASPWSHTGSFEAR